MVKNRKNGKSWLNEDWACRLVYFFTDTPKALSISFLRRPLKQNLQCPFSYFFNETYIKKIALKNT